MAYECLDNSGTAFYTNYVGWWQGSAPWPSRVLHWLIKPVFPNGGIMKPEYRLTIKYLVWLSAGVIIAAMIALCFVLPILRHFKAH